MQRAMGDKVKGYTKGAPSNDYAGLASHFVELARRKVRTDGTIALVLPLSAMSGKRWEGIRRQFRNEYQDIVVVTIAGEGDFDKSFSQTRGWPTRSSKWTRSASGRASISGSAPAAWTTTRPSQAARDRRPWSSDASPVGGFA